MVNRFLRYSISFLLLLALGACQSEQGPEGALKSFIEYRFSAGQDKDTLLEQTGGSLRERIEGMPEEDLESYLNNSQYKMRKFKVNYKKCENSGKKCFITYTISYDQMRGEEKIFAAEIKKIAEMQQVSNSWKVADVSNVKTYYESEETIKTQGEK